MKANQKSGIVAVLNGQADRYAKQGTLLNHEWKLPCTANICPVSKVSPDPVSVDLIELQR